MRDNIDRFGGDPNLVTIFGQSGGGRKVATLMSMPGAKGLFHRAIIESGAVLRLTTKDDAVQATELLLAELGLAQGQARDLQDVPMAQLLAANARREREADAARAGSDRELADGRRQGDSGPPVGPGRTRAVGGHPAAHRLCADRGDALRPADAGEAGAGRGGAEAARRARVSAAIRSA